MNKADSMDNIDSILDSPDNIAILNGSSWNVVQQVTLENKSELVRRLIDEEVIIKRERDLKALRKGLETLGLQKLLIRYTSLMKPYFYSPITPDEFFVLVVSCNPATRLERQAYDYFKQFVVSLHGEQ